MRHADLTRLTEHELVTGRRQLGTLRSECGCRTGELTMLVALVAALGHIVIGRPASTATGALVAVGEIVLALLAGGGIGKGAGILTARVRYVRRSRHLIGAPR